MKANARLPFFVASIVTIVVILVCISFLDAITALSVKNFQNAHPFLKKRVAYIPNLLPMLVCIGTLALLSAYLFMRKHINSYHAGFLKLSAMVLPVAFLLKMILQYAFGRTSIRYWLKNGGPIEFNLFTPLEKVPCFPSGHMTVFTAFFTAVWLYYPRYRPLAVLALTSLGFALVVTNYHFLGDVIAGAWCGILITTSINHFTATTHESPLR